jgi:hypothetical protein
LGLISNRAAFQAIDKILRKLVIFKQIKLLVYVKSHSIVFIVYNFIIRNNFIPDFITKIPDIIPDSVTKISQIIPDFVTKYPEIIPDSVTKKLQYYP